MFTNNKYTYDDNFQDNIDDSWQHNARGQIGIVKKKHPFSNSTLNMKTCYLN